MRWVQQTTLDVLRPRGKLAVIGDGMAEALYIIGSACKGVVPLAAEQKQAVGTFTNISGHDSPLPFLLYSLRFA